MERTRTEAKLVLAQILNLYNTLFRLKNSRIVDFPRS